MLDLRHSTEFSCRRRTMILLWQTLTRATRVCECLIEFPISGISYFSSRIMSLSPGGKLIMNNKNKFETETRKRLSWIAKIAWNISVLENDSTFVLVDRAAWNITVRKSAERFAGQSDKRPVREDASQGGYRRGTRGCDTKKRPSCKCRCFRLESIEFDGNEWIARSDHAARSISMPREVGLPTARLSIPTDFPITCLRSSLSPCTRNNQPGENRSRFLFSTPFNVAHSTFLKLFREYCVNMSNEKQEIACKVLARRKPYISNSHYFSQIKWGNRMVTFTIKMMMRQIVLRYKKDKMHY